MCFVCLSVRELWRVRVSGEIERDSNSHGRRRRHHHRSAYVVRACVRAHVCVCVRGALRWL